MLSQAFAQPLDRKTWRLAASGRGLIRGGWKEGGGGGTPPRRAADPSRREKGVQGPGGGDSGGPLARPAPPGSCCRPPLLPPARPGPPPAGQYHHAPAELGDRAGASCRDGGSPACLPASFLQCFPNRGGDGRPNRGSQPGFVGGNGRICRCWAHERGKRCPFRDGWGWELCASPSRHVDPPGLQDYPGA